MTILFRSDKRALSNVVGYVLLIAITIALSVLVYNWLKFYVGEEDVAECSDGVGVIISDYNCYASSGGVPGRLLVTLKNKGRFSIDGYSLRVHNRSDADFGIYTLNDTGVSIAPGEEYEDVYSFNASLYDDVDEDFLSLTFVEVQPFIMDGDEVSCRAYASQEIVC